MRSSRAAAGALPLFALAALAQSHQQSAVDAAGPQAARIGWLLWFFIYLLTVIFVLVMAVAAISLSRRHRGIQQEPLERTHSPSTATEAQLTRVVSAATVATIVILLGLLVASVSTGKALSALATHKNGLAIEVTGNQWWWQIRYLNSDPSRMVVTANEIHIPVGRPVMIRGTSHDVIHSFWAPNLQGKIDLIPSRVNTQWLQADHPGRFRGQCAEFCGMQHAHMVFWIVAERQEQFDEWTERQIQPAIPPADPNTQRGQQVFVEHACVMCHAIAGTSAAAQAGPDLTHFGSRLTIAAGTLPNTKGNLAGWIADPQNIKPGNHMATVPLQSDEVQPLLDYLESLKMTPLVDARPRELDDDSVRPQLEKVWAHLGGVRGWFSVTTHQAIGLRYIVTAFLFLLAGGVEALLMRLQLAHADNTFLSPDKYNQIFTVHGSTMMFLFAVPVMEGMGIYFVPLMLGTRNVAFPRLNAFGYWMYVIGGIFLYVALFTNTGPDAGWFAYTPLSGPQFSPGKRVDVWAQMITFTEISAMAVAAELAATIMKMRAPGMSLNRIPLFCWGMLVQSFMVLFAMPAVMVASNVFLLTDRTIGTHFANPSEGGDPLLYQHVFWFFGHPEVYIIFIPALGMVSAIIDTNCRRAIFGYPAMVLSLVFTAFVGFGLWVHHMFATGLPQIGEAYFTAASMMIAIASGVQIFCWLATMWTGRIRLTASMHFVLGFIFIFVLGGLTGVMLAAIPLDLQVHDTFFVVAHFHYVLIGGALFPLFGGFHHWFPKFTGRMIDERLGKLTFWVLFIGFNLTFFPMHILGLKGMTRRIYTYPAEMGWDHANLLATIGAFTIATGGVIFIANVLRSRKFGTVAGNDPWDSGTFEWAASSPPANYNFVHLPAASSRYPLWTPVQDRVFVTGLRNDRREVLVTTVMDAEPQHRYVLPGPSIWPLITAILLTIGLIGAMFQFQWYYIGVLLGVIAFVGWFWPRRPLELEP